MVASPSVASRTSRWLTDSIDPAATGVCMVSLYRVALLIVSALVLFNTQLAAPFWCFIFRWSRCRLWTLYLVFRALTAHVFSSLIPRFYFFCAFTEIRGAKRDAMCAQHYLIWQRNRQTCITVTVRSGAVTVRMSYIWSHIRRFLLESRKKRLTSRWFVSPFLRLDNRSWLGYKATVVEGSWPKFVMLLLYVVSIYW